MPLGSPLLPGAGVGSRHSYSGLPLRVRASARRWAPLTASL